MDQMDKNTVPAKDQLKDQNCIRFFNTAGTGKRILFVGNSITLHGYRPEIGWYGRWGMAASAEEKDYVHLTMKNVTAIDPDAAFCICQVADWERNFRHGEEVLEQFAYARAFEADIILLRMVENCPKKEYEYDLFLQQLDKLVRYLDSTGKAKVIVTTGFWKHPADEALRAWAKANNAPLCELGHLGEQDEMKAIGLFEHSGVANHPGDAGMQAIADAIWKELRPMLEE